MFRSLAALLVCLSLTAATFAEDLQPPAWRGDPGTSWVQWEFLDDANPPMYDDGFLPFGDPEITVTPGPGAGYWDKQPTAALSGGPMWDPDGVPGDGWWNLSGEIVVTLENQDIPNPRKEIWIQLTWEPQAPGNVPFLQVLEPGPGPETSIPLQRIPLWEGQDPTNPWRTVYHDIWHLDLQPNPPFETLKIRGGINVDELVIDTWCVPEPATLSLLALGGLALIRRR